MKNLNNKGQVLVLFVIILPILLLLILAVIEVGNINLEKAKTKNTIKEIIETNLKNYDENTNSRINTLIETNIDDIKTKSVFTSEDEIRIILIQKNSILGRQIEIKYKYKGLKEKEKITISEG